MERPVVGVRELKEQASEIIRRVREEGVSFDVTYRGDVVATIRPIDHPTPSREERLAAVERGTALAKRLANLGPDGQIDAAEMIRRDRDRQPW
jgi:antitoxin (DNA-binding transcriptional repressor) of toxin-antitoxin stability system